MKPSERIREIARDRGQAHPGLLDALAYLDDRHEAENDPRHQLAELREALGAEDLTHEQALEVARQGVAALTLEGFESRDAESLQLLRECIDENLAYPSEESEEAGDYCAAIRYAADRLHGLRSSSGDGLRAALEKWVQRTGDGVRVRCADRDISEAGGNAWLSAVDQVEQLLAAHPAPTSESAHDRACELEKRAYDAESLLIAAQGERDDLRARIDRAVVILAHIRSDLTLSEIMRRIGSAKKELTQPSPADGASEEIPKCEGYGFDGEVVEIFDRDKYALRFRAANAKYIGTVEVTQTRGFGVYLTREQARTAAAFLSRFASTGSLKGAGK